MSDPNDPNANPDDTSAENFAKLRESADATKRENAFLRSGIDVDTPQGKLLMKGYEGPLEVDAIKAYREEIFPAPPATTEGDEPAGEPAAEPAAQEDTDPYARETQGAQAMRDALAGTGQPGTLEGEKPKGNVIDETFEAYHSDRKNGIPQERAALAAIDRFIVAGAEGNPDVLLDPQDWEARKAEAGHMPSAMKEKV